MSPIRFVNIKIDIFAFFLYFEARNTPQAMYLNLKMNPHLLRILEESMARPSRKIELQEKIFAAAFELIAKGGFHQSPMSKLANLAKVSVGTIYIYFENKDALVLALFERVRAQMEESILVNYNAKLPIKSRFQTLFLNIGDYYRHHKEHFIFMDQFALSDYNKSGLDAFSDKVSREFLSFYNDGIKSKELKKIRFENMMSITHGPIASLIKKHHTGFLKVTSDILVELEECVWLAIKNG